MQNLDFEIFPVPRVLTNKGEWVQVGSVFKEDQSGGVNYVSRLKTGNGSDSRINSFFQNGNYSRAINLPLATFLTKDGNIFSLYTK